VAAAVCGRTGGAHKEPAAGGQPREAEEQVEEEEEEEEGLLGGTQWPGSPVAGINTAPVSCGSQLADG
jgi:hypothetical protein